MGRWEVGIRLVELKIQKSYFMFRKEIVSILTIFKKWPDGSRTYFDTRLFHESVF